MTTHAHHESKKMRGQSRSQRLLARSLVAIWILAIGANLVGLHQIFRAEQEFHFLTNQIVPLSNDVLRLLHTHLEISVEGERAVQLMRLSGTQPEAKEQLEELTPRILRMLTLQRDAVQAIGRRLEGLSRDFVDIAGLTKLSKVFRSVEAEHSRFARSLEASLTSQPKSVETREMVRLARALFDENSAILSENLSQMMMKSVEKREERKFLVLLEMGVASVVFLVLGGVLFVRIRSLQKELLVNEKKVLLGDTAVALQHEINNALSVIVSNTFLLARDGATLSSRRENARAIDEAVQRINEVLHRMGALNKIESVEYLPGVQMLNLNADKEEPIPEARKEAL